MKSSFPSALALIAMLATTSTRNNIAQADLVLSKEIMDLSKIAVELSNMVYQEEDPSGKGYDAFEHFSDGPDRALSAKKLGYCFAAFRGDVLTWEEWQKHIDYEAEDVCDDIEDDGVETCCTTRKSFYDSYFEANYRDDIEQAIRDCAKDCKDADECVVLTGYSQGGGTATVAALQLADLNPYVITFGQPPALDAPCELVTSERWFRYINTKGSHAIGMCYDPIPFVLGLGTNAFGHMMLLADDNSGVAYIGLDAQDIFGQPTADCFNTHSMEAAQGSEYPGYLDRIEILANGTFPVNSLGFAIGSHCSQDKECITDRCDSGMCIPKLGSCMPCDEAGDCAGGQCILYKCSGSNGLMDNNCVCRVNGDCRSGRCDGMFLIPQCEAQLGLGASCNENSDCISNFCSWQFRCEMAARASLNAPTRRIGAGAIIGIVVGVLVLIFAVRKYCQYRRGRYQQVPAVDEETT